MERSLLRPNFKTSHLVSLIKWLAWTRHNISGLKQDEFAFFYLFILKKKRNYGEIVYRVQGWFQGIPFVVVTKQFSEESRMALWNSICSKMAADQGTRNQIEGISSECASDGFQEAFSAAVWSKQDIGVQDFWKIRSPSSMIGLFFVWNFSKAYYLG